MAKPNTPNQRTLESIRERLRNIESSVYGPRAEYAARLEVFEDLQKLARDVLPGRTPSLFKFDPRNAPAGKES